MKHLKTHKLRSAALIGGALLSAQAVQANATFNGSALLTYTINSITNLDHPNDFSGLQILGFFEQPTDPCFYVNTTGDGAVLANNPSVAPFDVNTSFSQSFTVSGSAVNGTVDSYHTGWFNLDFNNTGTDSYTIDLSLGYHLTAGANGLFANSSVALDYGLTGNAFAGSDHTGAYTIDGYPNDSHSVTGTNSLVFTLASGDYQSVYATAVITGNLESVSAVPVPAAVWFFASGLLGLTGLDRRKLGTG